MPLWLMCRAAINPAAGCHTGRRGTPRLIRLLDATLVDVPRRD
ncbi:hypothetical protein [Erwinia sp. S59]|nr:hypothetical protein [Erwinia sp. S59]